MIHVEFQENPLNERGDAFEIVRSSSSKASFVVDQSRSKLHMF